MTITDPAGSTEPVGLLAKNTFAILAVIDFCWAAIIWVFDKGEIDGFMSEMIKKVMTIRDRKSVV